MAFWPCTTTNRRSQDRHNNGEEHRHFGERRLTPPGRGNIYRCGISKCLRPNRRASMDHAPGPIIASAAPDAANRMEIPPLPAPEQAIHTSSTAINVPQTGVHKPRSSSIPAPVPIRCGTDKDASLRRPNPKQNRNAAVIARCRRSPLPGQPFGNAEKRRCKSTPFFRVEHRVFTTGSKDPNEGLLLLLSEDL
jgi:hypothetical protein